MSDEALIAMVRGDLEASGEALPPAPAEAVAEIEDAVGLPMPSLLKRIYLEVADGGFGCDGQALSLTDDSYQFSDADRMVEEYRGWLEMDHEHPRSVVPLLTLGCAIWIFVDFATPDGRTWGWDPNASCPRHALYPEPFTLAERLADWLADGALDDWRPDKHADCPEC